MGSYYYSFFDDRNGYINYYYNAEYIYDIYGGYCKIIKYVGHETDVVIPKKIDDCEVVWLCKDAFSGCDFIKSVDLSNIETSRSIRIDKDENLVEAFSNCSNVEYVKIPSGLRITNQTFKGCFNLKFIEFGDETFELCNLGMLDDCVNLEKCSISNREGSFIDLFMILKSNKNFKNIKIHIRDGNGDKDYDMETFKTIAFNSNYFPFVKFSDCSEIESFAMDKDVVYSCEAEEFKNCINLKSFKFNRFVEQIRYSYFEGCVNLEKITIPKSVKKIEPRAFFNCTKLKSIKFPEGMRFVSADCFGNCKNLKTVTFSDNITKIQKGAFKNCSNIKEIVLPSGIEEIDDEAFCGCTSLESIVIPESIRKIGKEAFCGCTSLESIVIPGSIAKIYKDAFKDCKKLTIKYAKSLNCWKCVYNQNDSTDLNIIFGEDNEIADEINSYLDFILSEDGLSYSVKWNGLFGPSIKELVIPNSYKGKPVISIDEEAFEKCGYLQSVIISDGIKIIKLRAFIDCENLEYVKLPNSIVEIEPACFARCTNLKSINLPNSIISIGEVTFSGCDKLTSIELPNSLTTIENALFKDSGLKFIELPNSIVKIGDDAFCGCKLESINLPNSIISIGEFAFYKVYLKSINLPNSIISIGECAFYKVHLKSIILPSSIKSIGRDSFTKDYDYSIFYLGTQSEWNEIEIADKWNIIKTDVRLGCENYKSILEKKVSFYSEEVPTNGFFKYWKYDYRKQPTLWKFRK